MEKGGVNLYEYVQNNPISRRDPSGMFDTTWVAPVITAATATAGLAGAGIVGTTAVSGYGAYDIGTRGIPEMQQSWGTLTGAGGWLNPGSWGKPKPTSCPIHMNEGPKSEGMGPVNTNPGGADAPSGPGHPYPGELGPQGPGEGITPGGQGAPADDSSAWRNPENRDMINELNKQYYGTRPPSWD